MPPRPRKSVIVAPTSSWSVRLVRNLLLGLIPSVLVWLLITPFYNHFLAVSAENVTRWGEFPPVTRLYIHDSHFLLVTRSDVSAKDGFIYKFRLTDVHFNLILTAAFFLGVPSIDRRRRFENLGMALLLSVVFHILILFFIVKFVYATQLGEWSNAHYGAFAQNFWGFGKHLLDLPFKLALPFMLWAGFYFSEFQNHLQRRAGHNGRDRRDN
ncbi:MAG: hypothetical protein ABI639_08090 [Thermoanaerobaculia bacterium]